MSRLALLILIIGVIHRANAGTKTCAYTWVTPITGTAAGTYTRSIGAPLSFSMTINDDIESGDTSIWKDTDGTLVSVTSIAADAFPATGSGTGVTSSFTAGTGGASPTYAMTFTAGATADHNGKAIWVRNAGCDVDSPAITLTVTSCNLAVYGDQASATDQTACNNACAREFTCTHDTTETFTATCGEDASWDKKYAPCPCASAGVREVALLALVMLCSSLSATHLM